MHYLSEQNIFLFLIQVFLLLGFARIFGEMFRQIRQPSLTAEILVGIILGPTIFGRFFPAWQQAIFPADLIQQNMLETVAWLGVFFLLLEAGLEIDFSSAWRQKGDALKIAVTGVVIPMIIVFACSFFLPDRYLVDPNKRIIFALFMATVMSITAMPITIRVLYDLRIAKTDLGFLIMSAQSVNDILGWLIFTIILAMFNSTSVAMAQVVMLFGVTLAFVIVCLTMGRHFTNFVIMKFKEKQFPEPSTSLTFICLLGLLCGAITQKIGIHALFGFLLAGIISGEAKALPEKTRHVISQMVFAIFVPLFFASIGLRIDFFANFDLLIVLFVSIISILGKFIGAWVGTLFSEHSKEDRLTIAISHTPGGMMEIVVGILAMENNLITQEVFVAIICGAILSSVLLGPWLRNSLKKRKEIRVVDYFSKGTVVAALKSSERDKAIKELCEVASLQGQMPRVSALTEAVLKREETMGTAIEEGVAIPHARLASIKQPLVIFGRSPMGIEWNSPDGKPAQFVFLILTSKDDNEKQIQILRAIAKVMSDRGIREKISKAEDRQALWTVIHKVFAAKNILKDSL